MGQKVMLSKSFVIKYLSTIETLLIVIQVHGFLKKK